MMNGVQMKYFVLKPAGDSPYSKASRAALKAYAKAIEDENIQLSHDLQMWAIDEAGAANRRDIDQKFAATEQRESDGT